jgi:deoxyribodipyrimidine photo-lyase
MSTALAWFRRDLRLDDQVALNTALTQHERVFCVFIFDRTILGDLLSRGQTANRQVAFMLASLKELDVSLRQHGSSLITRYGLPQEEIPRLAAELGAAVVYANHDYEPLARVRDHEVSQALNAIGCGLRTFKDQVIFEYNEVMTQTGNAFSVFTPYKNAWLKRLTPADLTEHDCKPLLHRLARIDAEPLPSLEKLGFNSADPADLKIPAGVSGAEQLFRDFVLRIDHYKDRRDYPAMKGPSYLSAHLRFGTVSIRRLVACAHSLPGSGAQTWLSELIWREFYQMILWHHPHVVNNAFKPAFDALEWDNAPDLFATWCQGQTGYPLVDAAMRQLNQCGYMHNRLRMVTASFLTKDLGVDWRLGERYFADQLIDYDLAANNGGWQWAASTGCDAQPWFRIFNPVTQSEKFDAQGSFIRRYVPELAKVPDNDLHAPWTMSADALRQCGLTMGADYPMPIVDHAVARARTLARFGKIRAS